MARLTQGTWPLTLLFQSPGSFHWNSWWFHMKHPLNIRRQFHGNGWYHNGKPIHMKHPLNIGRQFHGNGWYHNGKPIHMPCSLQVKADASLCLHNLQKTHSKQCTKIVHFSKRLEGFSWEKKTLHTAQEGCQVGHMNWTEMCLTLVKRVSTKFSMDRTVVEGRMLRQPHSATDLQLWPDLLQYKHSKAASPTVATLESPEGPFSKTDLNWAPLPR